jgi:hypothetical protein
MGRATTARQAALGISWTQKIRAALARASRGEHYNPDDDTDADDFATPAARVWPPAVEMLGEGCRCAGRHDPFAEHLERQQRRGLSATAPAVPIVEPGRGRAGQRSRATYPR